MIHFKAVWISQRESPYAPGRCHPELVEGWIVPAGRLRFGYRIILMLVLLSLPVAASAQHGDAGSSDNRPTIAEQYESGFLRMALTFWTPKLNAYRVEIDRMFSSSDLVDLNELRTRAALLLERIRMMEREREKRGAAEYGSTHTTEVAPANPVPEPYFEFVPDAPDSPANDGTEQMDSYEQERIESEREWQHERAERLTEQVALLDEAFSSSPPRVQDHETQTLEAQDLYLPEGSDEHYYSEVFRMRERVGQIRHVSNWIARNYRPGMQEILSRVSADIDTFFEATRLHARDFAAARGSDLLANDEALVGAMLRTMSQVGELDWKKNLREREELLSVVEAVLLVYNGQDLREFVMIDGGPAASASIEALSGGDALGQNSPNPASSRTTIPYTLAGPGSSVVLQILDIRGTLVARFDQGSREAGSHSASIDVSSLAPGTYLYQLKVTAPAGERIFSRGMQVVR